MIAGSGGSTAAGFGFCRTDLCRIWVPALSVVGPKETAPRWTGKVRPSGAAAGDLRRPRALRGDGLSGGKRDLGGEPPRLSPDPKGVGCGGVTPNGFRHPLTGRCATAVIPAPSRTLLSIGTRMKTGVGSARATAPENITRRRRFAKGVIKSEGPRSVAQKMRELTRNLRPGSADLRMTKNSGAAPNH